MSLKFLYIAIQSPGTTSNLRGQTLQQLLPDAEWQSIDTDSVFRSQPRWARSLAFRLRVGPAVTAVNRLIREAVRVTSDFDIIWIDKAVYIWPQTIDFLRQRTRTLLHYTPDAAFLQNQSRFFESALPFFDRVVTTKTFELEEYKRRVPAEQVTLVTQSFDDEQHRPTIQFGEKRQEAVLIGLCEPDRERCVGTLLKHQIAVAVGGQGWERFRRQNEDNPNFRFLGARVFGAEYTSAISGALVGLGLVTKRFPELHTTRTFEIPACGTALATERNSETTK